MLNIGAFLLFNLTATAQTSRPPNSLGKGLAIGKPAPPYSTDPAVVKLVKRVSQKYAATKRYAFEGDLEVGQVKGENPRQVLAKAKVKLEVAPGGKFLLRVKDDKSEYSLVSDGHKTWNYVPALAQYTEEDAAAAGVKAPAKEDTPRGDLEKGATTERFSRQIMPLLAGLDKTAQTAFLRGPV